MTEPFLAEIRLLSFNFAPRGWAFCDGQLLPINQNQALFSILGITFGGNGQTTFALPNLKGRSPVHVGNGHVLGENGGEDTHTLSASEMPQHSHHLLATNSGATAENPTGSILATPGGYVYGPMSSPAPMGANSVSNAGSDQAHANMQPYLVVSFCIALQGIFPSRNQPVVD